MLKEKQKEQRKSSQIQSAAFMSYKQWLLNLNLTEEAEKWRHRKNKQILLLERPNNATVNETQEYIGLAGFSMSVTKQGVKFASQDNSKGIAFIDVGRVIKVYEQDDDGHSYAVQAISDEHLILHGVSRDDLPKVEAFIGRRVEITNDDYRIKSITKPRQLDKSRRWSR
ncbi:hypothetical protein FACS1894187_15520 [Synergistales bacterium]|nr:hypothetical protein FACS1894187_15520 [Synergistales bacterium]